MPCPAVRCSLIPTAPVPPLDKLPGQDNQLTAGLPLSWGSHEKEGLHALRILNLSFNPLGPYTLPYQWSREHSFPALRTL